MTRLPTLLLVLLAAACSSAAGTPTPAHTAEQVLLRVRLEPHPEIGKYTIGRVAGELGQTDSVEYVGNECWRVAFHLDGRETAAYHVGPAGPGVLSVDPDGGPAGECEALWVPGQD